MGDQTSDRTEAINGYSAEETRQGERGLATALIAASLINSSDRSDHQGSLIPSRVGPK